jgi:murein DD-endopeptidase MepM/ murein hydrolase activator NlpD
VFAAMSLVAAIAPPLALVPHKGDEPQFPAPSGYMLPWQGGSIEDVTQGEETSITHNGLAAYAFDFGMAYDPIVAARGGRVARLSDSSNVGGCDPSFASASNYLVIDHGDGTSSLYLHLAYDSIAVEVGALVTRGEAIAVSGDTGVTCSDDDATTAPHLHFQVQGTIEGQYFSQSQPVTFDDVPGDGVPQEGRSYVSGNFGGARSKAVKLTVARAQRPFNPKAKPDDPLLAEAVAGSPTLTPTPGESETPTPEATATLTAEPTPTPEQEPTGTPTPASPTPESSPTVVPATATPDSPASPLATPTPAATKLPVADTPAPPDPSETPTAP